MYLSITFHKRTGDLEFCRRTKIKEEYIFATNIMRLQ